MAASKSGGIRIAVAGNIFEWYDLLVYLYVAPSIAKNFFPAHSDFASLLLTYFVYGAAFLIRPLGAIVLGWVGDVKGRKTSLLLATVLMAAGTILIGAAPTYETIGIAAPVLIVISRLMQSFSVGGQWGGNTTFIVEWAPHGRRGLYGSLQESSLSVGALLGSGVAALTNTMLTEEAVENWGWRIPFLVGVLIVPIGFWMRRHLFETPIFRDVQQDAMTTKPIPSWQPALRAFGFTILWTVSYYLAFTYLPVFIEKYTSLNLGAALWSNTIGLIVMTAAVPLMGHLSDHYGRKPLLLVACLAFVVLPYPLFQWILSGASFAHVVAIHMLFGLL